MSNLTLITPALELYQEGVPKPKWRVGLGVFWGVWRNTSDNACDLVSVEVHHKEKADCT